MLTQHPEFQHEPQKPPPPKTSKNTETWELGNLCPFFFRNFTRVHAMETLETNKDLLVSYLYLNMVGFYCQWYWQGCHGLDALDVSYYYCLQ